MHGCISNIALLVLPFVLAGTLGAAQNFQATPPQPTYRVGEEVTPTDRIGTFPDATYTEEARKARIKGTVRLSALVGTDGCAHDIRVLSRLGYGLDESAVEAVRRWHWRPERIVFPKTKDGKVQPARVTGIEVNFDPRWSKVEPLTAKPCRVPHP